MSIRKTIRKSLASVLKRYYMVANGGYSVGAAYGARFLFDWRHSLDKKVAVELYEHDQIDYLTRSLQSVQPTVFLDIGSHAALYSVVLKRHFPAIEVHAFEPDRTNLCQLYANLFVNGFTRAIEVHEHGISNHNGTAFFEDSERASSRGTRRISNDGASQIEVRRLDDVITAKDAVIAIKIDVEGHECEVVEGARELLTANHCFIQVESSAENFPRLKEQLEGLGYRFIDTVYDHFFSNMPNT